MTNIRISKKCSAYFETADGGTFIPVGVNLCFVRNEERYTEEEILGKYAFWFENLSRNGGNFARIWLGTPFFNVMPREIGVFDEKALSHLREIVKLAEKFGIGLKLTLDHFRRIGKGADAEIFPGAANFNSSVYADVCSDMRGFLTSEAARKAWLMKAEYLAESGIGNSDSVLVWELWNEVDTIATAKFWKPWSEKVIPVLEKLFPRQLVVQNLGSFSGRNAYRIYDELAALKGNAFMQVHRYLDPGAELDVCRGACDILAADAIRELRSRNPSKPALLSEGGAVEKNHSGPSHLYDKDTGGTILHDFLFTPFFSGSAGCGQFWHWDYIYLEKHDLWYVFARFCRAIEGIDPVKECFVPFYTETHEVRVYALRGKFHTLYYCRDKQSSWAGELELSFPSEMIAKAVLPVESDGTYRVYDPWSDSEKFIEAQGGSLSLPVFRRSLVVCKI